MCDHTYIRISHIQLPAHPTSDNPEVMDPQTEESHRAALLKQVGAAIFYGLSSILIITVNKVVLTSYK